jgi:hypothetical protein
VGGRWPRCRSDGDSKLARNPGAQGETSGDSRGYLMVHFFAGLAVFLAAFLGFAGSSNVASTVRDMSVSVRPFATAFRTAFSMRFTAFFCFFVSSAVGCGGSPSGETVIVRCCVTPPVVPLSSPTRSPSHKKPSAGQPIRQTAEGLNHRFLRSQSRVIGLGSLRKARPQRIKSTIPNTTSRTQS